MADYSKWDAMAREEEAEEQREKELKRIQNREKYYREQEERKLKYMQDQEAKKKAGLEDDGHDHHSHSHGGDGDHSHGHSHNDPFGENKKQPLLEKIRRPACGCGYADVEEMKRAAEQAKNEPQISNEEKLKKKIAAVHATREHGKQLFQEGKYNEAFAVYERGVLIVSGIFDLTEKEQQEMTDLEVILDLNMAACKLKLSEWKSAQEQCRMALQLDPKNVKAYYRIGQAWIGLGEYGEARTAFAKVTELDHTGACKKDVQAQLNEIKRLEIIEKQQVKNFTKQLEMKMKKEAEANNKQEEEKEQHPSTQLSTDDATVADLAETLRAGQLSSASNQDNWTVDGPNQQPKAAASNS